LTEDLISGGFSWEISPISKKRQSKKKPTQGAKIKKGWCEKVARQEITLLPITKKARRVPGRPCSGFERRETKNIKRLPNRKVWERDHSFLTRRGDSRELKERKTSRLTGTESISGGEVLLRVGYSSSSI